MFTGEFKDGVSFQDMYYATIHSNGILTNIQKFYHLKNSLSDDIKILINNLELSVFIYEVAGSRLTNRYNNTRMLIQSHTKQICDLEPIHKESANNLRRLTYTSNMHIKALVH